MIRSSLFFRSCLVLGYLLLACCAVAQETQTKSGLIAASQGEASSAIFDFTDPAIPAISPGDFQDPAECAVGNGLPFFFPKAASGQAVRIAYLGGSITRSDNMYRLQSAKFIQGMFPGTPMTGINAGVSGTDADLGACRLQEQVLRYQPDLVFIEFAVNGGFPQGVEGIIRQTRKYNPAIDICLIYTATTQQFSDYQNGGMPPGIRKLEGIAAHYGIPAIHLAKEAAMLVKAGKLVAKGDPGQTGALSVFSQDGVHPLLAGGNLYAAAMARGLLKIRAAKERKAAPLPAPLYADNWEDAKMLAPEALARFSAGWTKSDPDTIGFARFKPWFPYLMRGEKPGDTFSFTFRGSMFGFFDIGGPEAGQLEMLVDGRSVRLAQQGSSLYTVVPGSGGKLNRFNVYCNNRYRGQFICITLPPGLHTVSFKISGEKADKRKILGEKQLQDITDNPEKYNKSTIYIGKILLRGVPVL